MTPQPRAVSSRAVHDALVAAGVIRATDRTRRIVIDLNLGDVARIYVERFGDERLLDVALSLDGVQVEVREVAG